MAFSSPNKTDNVNNIAMNIDSRTFLWYQDVS